MYSDGPRDDSARVARTRAVPDSIELRDQSLRTPWNPYLFDQRVTLGIEAAAFKYRVNAGELAVELLRSEADLKSLLIAPLIGTRDGVENSGVRRDVIERLFLSPALMGIPAVANFVGAAHTELILSERQDQFSYTNRNTAQFTLLRHRLETALVDIGVAERIYNVRPRYEFPAGDCPDASIVGLSDTLRFTLPNGNELTCRICSGGDSTVASRSPLFASEIRFHRVVEDNFGPLKFPSRALLGRYDPAWGSIDPRHSYGRDIERALLQHQQEEPESRPFYYVVWNSTGEGQSYLEMCPLPRVSMSIVPNDPSELAIRQVLRRREAEIVRVIESNRDRFECLSAGGEVLSLFGEDTGVRTELRRMPKHPFFELRCHYSDGAKPSRPLGIQEWIAALENELKKRGLS